MHLTNTMTIDPTVNVCISIVFILIHNTRSGHFTSKPHAAIGHHDRLFSSGHYTASDMCCNEVYCWSDDRVTFCANSNIRDPPTVYAMMYTLLDEQGVSLWLKMEGGSPLHCYGAGIFTLFTLYLAGGGIGTENCRVNYVFSS